MVRLNLAKYRFGSVILFCYGLVRFGYGTVFCRLRIGFDIGFGPVLIRFWFGFGTVLNGNGTVNYLLWTSSCTVKYRL